MNIVITGFTGSLGTILTKKLLSQGHHITGISRDELKQYEVRNHPNLVKYLCCIRDRSRVVEATRGAEIVFHCAALKQVDKGQENPEEFIQTNIIGTMNVLHAQRVNKIRRVVTISTDKAAYPITAYGATKLLAEILTLRNPVNNIVVRYGNVLGSRGSVLGTFIRAAQDNLPAPITHIEMTRFWITLDRASDFIIDKAFSSCGGFFVPELKAYPLFKFYQMIFKFFWGNQNEPRFKDVGLRSIEKIHECLLTEAEAREPVYSNSNHVQFAPDELEQILHDLLGEYKC